MSCVKNLGFRKLFNLEQDCEREDIQKVGVDERLASFGTICPFITIGNVL